MAGELELVDHLRWILHPCSLEVGKAQRALAGLLQEEQSPLGTRVKETRHARMIARRRGSRPYVPRSLETGASEGKGMPWTGA